MKTLYIDCSMGAAGDMLTAALLELVEDPEKALSELNEIAVPGTVYEMTKTAKCGITGTHISVKVDGVDEADLMAEHEHHHHHDHDHDHDHDHEHHHDHDHDHEHHHDHDHDHEHHHDHDHDHEHHHDHDHDHEHHHDHDHDHEHHHDHDHDHEHHHHHHHHHAGMADIEAMVEAMAVPEKVKKDVLAVYSLIAEAESHAHGVPVDQIHFHEVGTKDAVADVTAVCLLMNKLGIEKVVVSPIHVGSGHVHCAHGILPVPAPATAHILKDVPIYSAHIKGELCTPTGAALLKHFADEFAAMPMMKVEKIGYGCGNKDFEQANVVRTMLGEMEDDGLSQKEVPELSCNVDDMTAEEISFAMDRLFEAGALEVYTVSIGMKKSRPGTLIRVICKKGDEKRMAETMLRYTTTIGVRQTTTYRYTMRRSVETVHTAMGEVRRKTSTGYGITKSKWEYEDLARIAKEKGMTIDEVRKNL